MLLRAMHNSNKSRAYLAKCFRLSPPKNGSIGTYGPSVKTKKPTKSVSPIQACSLPISDMTSPPLSSARLSWKSVTPCCVLRVRPPRRTRRLPFRTFVNADRQHPHTTRSETAGRLRNCALKLSGLIQLAPVKHLVGVDPMRLRHGSAS